MSAKKHSLSEPESFLDLRLSRDKAIQAAREAVRDTTRLTRLISILNDPGPLSVILDRGLATLSELFLSDIVVLLDPVGTGSFSPLAAIGLPEDMIEQPFSSDEGGYVRQLMSDGVPLRSNCAQTDKAIDSQLIELGAEAVAGLPVYDNYGLRGALILARCHIEPFSEDDIGLLKTMSYRIGRTLIESQRSFQFEKIVESSAKINRYLDFNAVISEAVKMFPVIIRGQGAALVMKEEGGVFHCAGQWGLNARCCQSLVDISKDLITNTVLAKAETLNIEDVSASGGPLTHSAVTALTPIASLLVVPVHRKGIIHGLLYGARFAAISCNQVTSQTALLYAEKLSAALENSNLYQAVQKELMERKKLEEKQRMLERQQQQIQKANSLNSMAGGIAHHFNNLLGVVIGNLDMVMESLPPQSDSANSLSMALRGALRAADVSRLLLTYVGQTAGTRSTMKLAELCNSSLPLIEASAPKGVDFLIDIPAGDIHVKANANQIQQVLTNLITNAWEACDEEQGVVRLTVDTVEGAAISDKGRFPVEWQPEETNYGCIAVEDNGSGITEDELDKIFDPFYSSKFAGRGLGLPAALGIVKAHKGGIVVDQSKNGKGSNFKVFIPLTNSTETVAQRKSPSCSLQKKGELVLLVEDEEMVRTMTKSMLEHLGFQVTSAGDGVEAITIAREIKEKISLVLCDLSMPRMNGWETMAVLKRDIPDLPVILTSGHDESLALSFGNNEKREVTFLHKPFQVKELQAAIAEVFSG